MEIANLPLEVELPGRAGELQRAGDADALVRELGDHYGAYHAHLRARHAEARDARIPFGRTDDAARRAVAGRQHLVMAEAILRACRRLRRDGVPLERAHDDGMPMLDASGRLLSVEDPRDPDEAAPDWTPPAEPDWDARAGRPAGG